MFYTWLILLSILLFLFGISCVYALIIWIRRRKYTKERFAFAALGAIVLLATTFLTSVLGNTMPWDLVAIVFNQVTGEKVTVPKPGFADYGLLLSGFTLAIFAILSIFKRWDGLLSEQDFELGQRRESMSLVVEGIQELSRIIKREEPLKIHQSDKHRLLLQLNEPVSSLAWRDRARELLRLKMSCYVFSPDRAWHENVKCWVGKNMNTNDLVVLFCSSELPDEESLDIFITYSERLTDDHNESRAELILAVEDSLAPPINHWRDKEIQFETEETLLTGLVDWTDYKHDLQKRIEIDHLPDSTLSISNVYVSPKIEPINNDSLATDSLQEYIEEWLTDPSQKQLAILGDYGQGKSTSSLMIAHQLMEREQHHRIPILIELRGTSPRNLTPLELLGAWGAKYNLNPKALLHLHMAGRLFLIFEGFDEIALIGDSEMRLKHFRVLWEFCYPQAKILITGRPNFFFDESEMIASLGIREPIAGRPYCQALRLKLFDLSQISNALRKHDRDVRDEICSFAAVNEQFRELISRPSLLHIVSVLWRSGKLSNQIDKLTSAFVIDLFIRHSYLRQGLKEAESPDFMALTNEERHYFMKGIATYMVAKRLPNQIYGPDLNGIIDALINSMPEAVSLRSLAITGEIREPLKKRLSESEHGLEHVRTDVRTCGLLVDDPATSGAFRFGHKSFMEYLFADVVAERIIDHEIPDAPSILVTCRAKPIDISYLPVSIEFLSELLGTTAQKSDSRIPNQKFLALRLLRLLCEYNLLHYILPVRMQLEMHRLALYNLVLLKSTKSMNTLLRIGICFTLNPFISFYALFLCIYFFTNSDIFVFGTKEMFASIISGISFGIIGVLFASWRVKKERRNQLETPHLQMKTPFQMWNLLCKKLKFSDRILFRIAYANWMPWTRNQKFDYFVKLEQEDIPNNGFETN